MPIGPAIPSHLIPNTDPSRSEKDPISNGEALDVESSDDDYSPALPPDMLGARIKGPSVGPSAPPPLASSVISSKDKKVLGPSMPSASSSSAPAFKSVPPRRKETPLSAAYSDDDDDEDGPGPMPLPEGSGASTESDGVRAFREREEREAEKRRKEEEHRNRKPQREEWMLVPPKEMDLLSSMDTTKLKSRTFNQSTKTVAKGKGTSSGPNLWTETPAERQQRMEDELLGRKGKAELSAGGGDVPLDEAEEVERRRKRERDWQLREEVERHNKAARATSLLDSHSKARKHDPEKDSAKGGAPGIWDRDRDMSIGGRLMDDGKRADIVKSAKELGGRFGGGSYL